MTTRSSTRRYASLAGAVSLAATVLASAPPASAEPVDSWVSSALHLADAHKKVTGKGVTVAVIDSALDASVPDLDGARIQLGQSCGTRAKTVSRRHDFVANHGTAMTTIIAGQGAGNTATGAGVAGVAPGASIRFYEMDRKTASGTTHDCLDSEIGDLFDRAVADGADIISFSTTNVSSLDSEVKAASDAGVVVVAGAGEENGEILAPASIPGVVAVMAVDKSGKPWTSNPHIPLDKIEYGFPVISAPGVDVPAGSMDKTGAWYSGDARTGTSDATAVTSGLLALLKSAYPKATGNQLVQQLIHFAGDGTSYGWDKQYGFGTASITQMLKRDPTQWPDINPLLNGPQRALTDFPASIYGKYPGAKTLPAAQSSATPGPAGAGAGSSASTPDTKRADASASDPGGIPVWVWPVAIVLLVLLAGAILVQRRRTRTSTPRTTTPSDTHEGAHS